MLKIQNLFGGYGSVDILKGINVECQKGEITTIIGENGSGKSTLLKAILGFITIKKGDILIDGNSALKMTQREKAQKISYLSQGNNFSDINVLNAVLQGRFPYLSFPRKYKSEDYEKAYKAIKKIGIDDIKERPLSSLSFGTRQKVYIATSLCQETDIILFDEPTAYLDIKHQFVLAEILLHLSKEQKAVLTVMHDIPLALKISHKIAIMKDGEIIMQGTPKEIFLSNIIPKIFGIEIISFETDGNIEYYCRYPF